MLVGNLITTQPLSEIEMFSLFYETLRCKRQSVMTISEKNIIAF